VSLRLLPAICLLLAALVVEAIPASADAVKTTGIDVVDGDTIEVQGKPIHFDGAGAPAASSISVHVSDHPSRRDIAESRFGRNDRPAHEPDRGLTAGVAPEDVTRAIAIVVAGELDRPSRRYSSKRCALQYLTVAQ
jgi:hypothetical protein